MPISVGVQWKRAALRVTNWSAIPKKAYARTCISHFSYRPIPHGTQSKLACVPLRACSASLAMCSHMCFRVVGAHTLFHGIHATRLSAPGSLVCCIHTVPCRRVGSFYLLLYRWRCVLRNVREWVCVSTLASTCRCKWYNWADLGTQARHSSRRLSMYGRYRVEIFWQVM